MKKVINVRGETWERDTVLTLKSWAKTIGTKPSLAAVHASHAIFYYGLAIDAKRSGDVQRAIDCASQFGMFTEAAYKDKGCSLAMQRIQKKGAMQNRLDKQARMNAVRQHRNTILQEWPGMKNASDNEMAAAIRQRQKDSKEEPQNQSTIRGYLSELRTS